MVGWPGFVNNLLVLCEIVLLRLAVSNSGLNKNFTQYFAAFFRVVKDSTPVSSTGRQSVLVQAAMAARRKKRNDKYCHASAATTRIEKEGIIQESQTRFRG